MDLDRKAVDTGGVGLGLSVSHSLSKLLNQGEESLKFESSVGKGSLFYFSVKKEY